MTWHISGDYFESCNCDAICPCRKVGDVPGGRSTHGICFGVLSWLVRNGEVDGLDLGGLAAAFTIRYDDDEPGSPWSFVVYVDERGSEEQRDALAAILTGRLGGGRPAAALDAQAEQRATCGRRRSTCVSADGDTNCGSVRQSR